VDKKRRLPVLNTPSSPGAPNAPSAESGEDDGAPRPPWHWIGFGTVAVFVVWVPLSYVAELVRARATRAWIGDPETPEAAAAVIAALGPGDRAKLGLVVFVVHGLALAASAFAGGWLVGRYAKESAGVREAALAGFMAALVATVLAWSGLSWVPLVTMAVAAAAGAVGGRVGKRHAA
jgi:hypothetical protein